MRFKKQHVWVFTLIVALVVTACSGATSTPEEEVSVATATATALPATPTPLPPTELTVCLANEPDSLYLYGASNREADTVFEAIYDGPIDLISHSYSAVILTELPTLENGAAQVTTVVAGNGDRYFNPQTTLPDNLKYGKPYLPAGCMSASCMAVFQGGEVEMLQLEAQFTLLEGLKWSDGEPLTAADSVFSYEIESDAVTPTTKYLVDRTSSYTQVDETTVRWVGLPGFMDSDFQANFWHPLPAHQLAEYSAAQLLEVPESARMPLGWGPYVLESWQDGVIHAAANSLYISPAGDGPGFDFISFRFLGADQDDVLELLADGECDLLDESLFTYENLVELQRMSAAEEIAIAWAAGPLVERMDFNLVPAYGSGVNRYFDDVQTRQAIAACIDRQGILDDVMFGYGARADAYLPADYPGSDATIGSGVYDIEIAAELLTQAGWILNDGQSVRTSLGVWNVTGGIPLQFTLRMTDGAYQHAMGSFLQSNLADCGIDLKFEYENAATAFASWPDGDIFGRRFESVLWAWPVLSGPPCEMYLSDQKPSNDQRYGINASGYSNAAYDEACRSIQNGLPGMKGYQEAVTQTIQLLAEDLPGVPLLQRPRIVAHSLQVCNVDVDSTAFSVLWNLEEIKPCSDR